MEKEVKEEIIATLTEVCSILSEAEYGKLKEVSNRTINNASIFQDPDSVSIAVLVYALFKILERGAADEKFITDDMCATLTDMRDFLKQDNRVSYRDEMKKLIRLIQSADKKFKFYIEQVMNQAEIKKGSKLYATGISLARAAEILGITQWELMNYVGKTQIAEEEGHEMDIRKRLEFTRRLFEQ